MIAAILFAAVLMADQPAPGGSAPPTTPPATSVGARAATPTKTAKADPERVCKLEPVLGSKITKKVCYNRAQLDERTFYDKQNLDLMQAKTPGPFSN